MSQTKTEWIFGDSRKIFEFNLCQKKMIMNSAPPNIVDWDVFMRLKSRHPFQSLDPCKINILFNFSDKIPNTPTVSLKGKKISAINTRSSSDLSPPSDWPLARILASDWSPLTPDGDTDQPPLPGGHWPVSGVTPHLISSARHSALHTLRRGILLCCTLWRLTFTF